MDKRMRCLSSLPLAVLGSVILTLLTAASVFAANAAPQPTVGKWIDPIIYLGAFALLANGLMHLDPERKKADQRAVGVITAAVGLMWWPFLIAMMSAQGLGKLTNFITGLAGMYSFFFIAAGFLEIFKLPFKSLGPVSILIGWLTLGYGIFFVTATNPTGHGTWVYHFSIAFVWFVAMNFAGLMQQGKVSERLTGAIVTFAALYTFAIPALFWAMPPGLEGPF